MLFSQINPRSHNVFPLSLGVMSYKYLFWQNRDTFHLHHTMSVCVLLDGKRGQAMSLWYWWSVWLRRAGPGGPDWAHQSVRSETLRHIGQGCDCHPRHLWMGASQHQIYGWYAGCQWIHVCKRHFCILTEKCIRIVILFALMVTFHFLSCAVLFVPTSLSGRNLGVQPKTGPHFRSGLRIKNQLTLTSEYTFSSTYLGGLLLCRAYLESLTSCMSLIVISFSERSTLCWSTWRSSVEPSALEQWAFAGEEWQHITWPCYILKSKLECLFMVRRLTRRTYNIDYLSWIQNGVYVLLCRNSSWKRGQVFTEEPDTVHLCRKR